MSNNTVAEIQLETLEHEFLGMVNTTSNWYNFDFKNHPVTGQILNLEPEKQKEFVLALITAGTNYNSGWYGMLHHFITALLRRKLPFEPSEIIALLSWSTAQRDNYARCLPQVVKTLEDYLKQNGLTTELQQKVLKLVEIAETNVYKHDQKYIVKLKQLGGNNPKQQSPLVAGEAWSDAAIADVEALNEPQKTAWINLLNYCRTATAGSPKAKWLDDAKPLIEQLGFQSFKQFLLTWFPLVDKPRTQPFVRQIRNELLIDASVDILKALAWLCAEREDHELARALTALAISAYRKVAGIGARHISLGNACVWALGAMPGSTGVGQLALLKIKIKFGTAQKGIEKALNVAANRIGLPAEEIEEMSVPTYGLTEVGVGREAFGDYTAELVVTGTHSVELRWLKSDGKPQKSIPAAVKQNHPEELKELNQAAKDIKKMLPAQSSRIEHLYLEERRWTLAVWRERYLDHPLVGTLARRLIWLFTASDRRAAGIWLDGKIVGLDEKELDWLGDETTVELWHPLHPPTGEATNTVLWWRELLLRREIQQPFKQAHREIYLLTDAERNTNTYSNRFAAHVIKQHQFNALCAARGWKNALRLMVDDSYLPPLRELKPWSLRAEFWVEPIGDDYGTDTTESGSYLYLTTDQVRFYRIDAPEHYSHGYGGGYTEGWNNPHGVAEPLPLTQIPPLVLSEIMRDADLFVGVASVGNDPNWADGGTDGRYRDYWHSYSFGELGESAKTRREVLSKLVPRLKIADRCELSDKFLFVRGDLRTYKIHLGSGNILMSPADQYLCIVPSGTAEAFGGGKVFLPFEGDRTLAIILSKAFMLADDTKITDSTIVRQIKR